MTLPFEEAFKRLEEILEKMNSGTSALEESLQLFDAAEGLISNCNTRLTSSEQRIEALVKQRDKILVDKEQKPKSEPFNKAHEEVPF